MNEMTTYLPYDFLAAHKEPPFTPHTHNFYHIFTQKRDKKKTRRRTKKCFAFFDVFPHRARTCTWSWFYFRTIVHVLELETGV